MLKKSQLPPTTRSHAFKLMRRLAGASRQVPKSYLVGPFTVYEVEKKVIASGGFGNIRKGRLNGMDVAVKTIRIPTKNEKGLDEIHEVRRAVHFLILDVDRDETPNLGLLQGMRGLDEPISSQHSPTCRSQNQRRCQEVFHNHGDNEEWKYY